MGDDPFRRLFLDMIEVTIKKEPGQESLHELLQLATPGLDESTLNNPSGTQKLFRTLITRVHPDKHPKDVDRATRLCQDVKVYYDKCVAAQGQPKKKKRKVSMSPKSKTAFPLSFTIASSWPRVDFQRVQSVIVKKLGGLGLPLSSYVGYQCINMRGGHCSR